MTADDFEALLAVKGYTFTRLELMSRPTAIHWHIRNTGEKGTLEATLQDGKVTLEVRSNRRGSWTDRALTELGEYLSER